MQTNYLQILQQHWGYSDFRGIQREIIESIGAGRDTLGLMPTGGGKSITFQVPALAKEGICLVISPLIALMKDQVEHLQEQGIKAVFIHSGMQHEEVLIALENCIYGNFKFLYVSPERFSSELFRVKLSHMNVSFITVDEAHCISQWGYDFRPAYLRIAKFRELLPDVPILALTATATPKVINDIQEQLHFHAPNVIQMSFARENLIYNVRRIDADPVLEVMKILQEIPGCAIVYTRSRRGAYEMAHDLTRYGVSATFYHAGMLHAEKTAHQMAWQQGKMRVMVATNAFGMGIDKADVRVVIHVDVPDSPEAYFQEAGRAGRDGKTAHAILLYNESIIPVLRRRVEETYPPKEYIAKVYDDMCSFLQIAIGYGGGKIREFSLEDFCRLYKHFPVRAYNALQILSNAGYIEWTDAEDGRSRILITASRDSLYTYHFSSQQDLLLNHLLRTSTGLFSEYTYIEEDRIAEKLGLTPQEVTEQLIELNRLHILNYIPKRYIPHITFVQRRLDMDEIILSPLVYDDRKKELQQRIETMIAYLQSTTCHSQFLLTYFGEKNTQPCGRCDACLDAATFLQEDEASYEQPLTAERYQEVRQHILHALTEHGSLMPQQLRTPDIPDCILAATIHRMIGEEEIKVEDYKLSIIS